MDDVLCQDDHAARIAALARLSGRAPEAVEQAIQGAGFELSADCGEIGGQACLDGTGARIGCRLSLKDWIAARRAAMCPFPDMLALAAR